MPLNEEIHTLLGLAISAIEAGETKLEGTREEVETKIAETVGAGKDAMHTLASMVLSDLRRIADSLEILAKEVVNAKPLIKS